ncbi:double-strand break repair helicase AddA [Celeribacter litoreus]|uniref:double-strand break repair helicase AddA n=1 Tax=Celeribacter litoreus TaxID=2876714 RepID=UPI001CCD01A0|nr:double-strand break repair helicase AddA [Celeribacter litoreus]MCA0042159.1 double-strand break repair helicase AddA [Celeribacter litoreus]
MTAPNEATRRQILAARPDVSTWVSANAGSGKTKVLTDRVARLLLDGTPPQHILCLTYTKAAAAEMQNRLFKRLGQWAMLPDVPLRAELSQLAPDTQFDDTKMRHARTLFARAIETPGGLKIQTIHSFCSALLRRFPLEAGVSPQFKEMDARQARSIVIDILEDLATGTGRDAIDGVAPYVNDLDLTDLALTVISNRDKFSPAKSKSDIWSWFGLPDGFDEQTLLSEVFLGGEKELFGQVAAILAQGGSTDQKNGEKVASWAGLEPSLGLIQSCCDALLFGEKTANPFVSKVAKPRGIPTKALLNAHPEIFSRFEDFGNRIENARGNLGALRDANRTLALHKFAQALLPPFLERKALLGLLDFDDMIKRTRDLLSISNVSQWVLYRLDGGIDHILVDEAQDTSPDQWDVIQRLASEFTSGAGARPDVTRTIFVVGDRKQSIYSFQGAAPEAFEKMKAHFGERLSAVDQPLQDLSLQHSFRSSRAILTATDAVFSESGGVGVGGDTEHISFFDDIPGRVDLWDLEEKSQSEKDPENWEDPVDIVQPEHHTARLSKKIADYVAELLENGTIPVNDTEARAIEPGDILILVRSRRGLFQKILNDLKSHPANIPVAGADRMILTDEMAVKDIRSLLAFLSLQDDDLALAEALRSPLFNWSERDLYQLAHGRTTITLWRELFERHDESEKWRETYEILNDLRKVSDFLRPYDLIERILINHGGRKKFIARLGKEAEDGIDALLLQAQNYETTETPSLTGFISWLQAQDVDIKRVLDENSNLVRVMTAHGAKGLEAPIVILPQTVRPQSAPRNEILSPEPDQAIWRSNAKQQSDVSKTHLASLSEAEIEEDRRLLYVAMTRAERWLIVCGSGDVKDGNWYQLVQSGLQSLEPERFEFSGGGGLRYQWRTWPEDAEAAAKKTEEEGSLPVWATKPVAPPSETKPVLSPSDLGGAKALAGEAALYDQETAMRRGSQLHKLIEVLPDIPADQREERARYLLLTMEDPALEEEIPALFEEARSVLDGKYEWDVFGENSLAEVPFSGAFNDHILHGIIDRLIVSPNRVQIIDYKSNAVVPETVENIPDGLLRQLGAYADAVAKIYPDRQIETAILWTKTATLQIVPLDIVMSALLCAATS